ncbi:MAG: RNA polymerase sigma factor [Limisphaerales bacterium]
MPDTSDELIPTRASLLARIKNLEDHDSWQDFFDTYWKLIYGVAVKRGLTPSEAQDVVQETMCSAVKHMPNFNYNRTVGTFKAWLLTMARWRIADQFRKRSPVKNLPSAARVDTDAVLDNIADKSNEDFEAIWHEQWEQALFDAALVKTRRKVDPQKFQIFDLLVKQRLSPAKVAEDFHMSVNSVYLVKHRITEEIKSEVERLKQRVV